MSPATYLHEGVKMGAPNLPNQGSNNEEVFHLHVVIDRTTYEKLIRVKLATRTPVYVIISKVLQHLDEEKIRKIVEGGE